MRTESEAGAASLAHEINNPLDTLSNFLFLIKGEAVLTEKGERYLALAQEELHRVADIARRALAQHPQSERPQLTDVPELLRSVLHDITKKNSSG
jgi:two-component system NtrC family sensor kinase